MVDGAKAVLLLGVSLAVNPAFAARDKAHTERKPAMRAYPNLPKEDLEAVVAYMASLKKK
jgi:hypothetical protein